jgi:hypothetical protein
MIRQKLVAVAPIALLVLAGLGFLALNGHILAAPSNQESIQCDDGTIPVSTGILSTWANTDFCEYTIDYTTVLSGGVPRDGIPPVYPEGYVYPEQIVRLGGTEPTYQNGYRSIDAANEIFDDQAPVISVELNGDARAYPLGVLTRHEIANTEIGGQPVAVTFCPLCNSALVFDRVIDGQEFHFGVSGFLRNSDLIMWDHETESWWQQATGEAIVGEMVGTQLEFVTSSLVSYGDFKSVFPDGQVFVAETSDGNVAQNYDYNPYTNYDSNDGRPFLFRGELDDRLPPTERVVGFNGDETDIAYPFEALEERVVINDTVDGESIVVFWQPGQRSALDGSTISESREVGSATVFDPTLDDGTVLTFYADGVTIRDEQTDSAWSIFGQAIDGELEGESLFQYRSATHFWFAWSAFFPETDVWSAE